MQTRKPFSDFKLILKSQSGIALMMVLSAVTILTALLAEFTFESKINKIKAFNLQDKIQAKLNAESGIQFAMARLRLYKESFNYLEKNKDAKDFVNQKLLNQIWEVPFAYPPTSSKMNARQKAAVEKFTKNTILQGEMMVTVKNISNLINLNMLRAPLMQKEDEEDKSDEEKESNQEYTVDFQVFDLLRKTIDKERENDENFDAAYADLDPNLLVSSIKFFISERDTYEDNFTPDLQNKFEDHGINLKFSSFSSDSELNLLAGWDDKLLSLIKNDITTHGVVMIDLNKITENMLKILIPDIDEEQIKEFFEYRDDPEEPHFFNNEEDFKNYIVQTAGIMSEEQYKERMEKLKKNGLKFGPAPTLFEITSMGKFGRSIYTLTAIVSIPAKPEPSEEDKKKKVEEDKNEDKEEDEASKAEDEESKKDEDKEDEDKDKKEEEKTPAIELLEPRIIEIFVN
jgi:hypothetical protein